MVDDFECATRSRVHCTKIIKIMKYLINSNSEFPNVYYHSVLITTIALDI